MAKKDADKKKRKHEKGEGTDEPRAKLRESRSFWFGVVGTILTLVATSVSVVLYLESRRCERQVNDANDRADAAKQEYEKRLRSIGFELGAKEQYVDVSQVVISPSVIPTLPKNTQRFDLNPGMAFFVADYPGAGWQQILTDEFALTEMMVGTEQATREAGSPESVQQLRESRVFLFRHPDSFTLDLRHRRRNHDAAPRLTLFPLVMVEAISHAFISDVIGAPPEARDELRRLLVDREQLSDPMARYSADERITAALDDMFRSDLAGQMLNSFLGLDLKYVLDYNGVQHRLLNVQKRAHALAIESQLMFLDVQVEGGLAPLDLQVNEVTWFFNGPDHVFLVKALIPYQPGQANPYDEWARRFLGGFKFVW
ncbi:MAG TPA: hypothetical protein VNA69_20010 [Thermoanaerobaculia bacterium]|nr:hypothetical protein [Thermoanaerobaculia bacterium]